MNRSLILFCGAASFFVCASAVAAEFHPNHLFVGSGNSGIVTEFDESGQFVRTIGDGAGLTVAPGPAFGPDGKLYVTNYSAKTIAVFDAAGPHGTKLGEIGATAGLNGPEQFAFGPNGHLYVATFSSSRIIEIDADGQKVREIGASAGMQSARGVAFGADGNLYATDTDELFVFDPSGTQLFKQGGIGSQLSRIAIGRNGRLYIADPIDDEIHEVTASGHLVKDLKPKTPFDPYGIAIAPNGNLLVSNYNGSPDEVLEVDLQGAVVHTIGDVSTLSAAGQIAIAPTRFKATISGWLDPTLGKRIKVVEKDAVLSVAPGTQAVMIQFPPIVESGGFADTLGLQDVVFHGRENVIVQGTKKYGIHATHLPESFAAEVTGSIELQVSGGSAMLGPTPASAKGTVQFSSGGGVFGGTIKSTKKL